MTPFQLAVAQNITINGRLFVGMLFVLCIVLHVYLGALLLAIGIAAAVLLDLLLPGHRCRGLLAAVAYGLPLGVALALLFIILR
jgi:hypothetical protein